ncbi:MAG TPA: hypothetical protein VKA46_09405 [Gemmataceae bacterium]|nr:hypothetical protein [Gemmataceae bacterium]
MSHLLLFAADDELSFVSFCHKWADVATIVGLAITLIGFGFTLWGLRRVRAVTREAVGKIGAQLLSVETIVLLRLVTEARDAGRDGHWPRAIDRCQQARLIAVPLSHNLRLREEERDALRKMNTNLRIVVQYIENNRLPPGSPAGNLPDAKKRTLDQMVTTLGNIQGRLQGAAMEV